MKPDDPFEGFPLEERTVERAAQCGISLSQQAAGRLAAHARMVLRINSVLQMTSITEPGEYLERHLGEAFEGAAMLDARASGLLLDLGSGNGYPGIPLAEARPGLNLVMAEASTRKAEFLRGVVEAAGFERARVHEAQVQRPADLADNAPIDVLVCRALGNWQKVLPRLAPSLAPAGRVLLWAGPDVEQVSTRAAWRKLTLVERRALPGRDASWIWQFR